MSEVFEPSMPQALHERFQLTETSMRTNREFDLSRTLTQVLVHALEALGAVRGSVVLVDRPREELVILAKIDPDGAWPPLPDQNVRLKFRVGVGIAGFVAQTGQPYNAPIASQDPHFIPPEARSPGTWSLLAVPLLSRNAPEQRILGVISIEGPDDRPTYFDEYAVDLLTTLAAEAVTSIEEATWPALLQSTLSSYRLKRIQAISQALVSQQTRTQILEQIARIALEELQADLLTLYPWDIIKQDFITPPIKLGQFNVPDAMTTPIHQGDVVDKVFHEWGSRFFSNAKANPKLLALGRVPARNGQPERERFPIREGVASAAILRLEVGTKRVGVLCVNWRREHPFDEGEQAVLEIFANHVAIALENARLMSLAIGEATAAQRERLHRDLHDWIGGNLSAITSLAAACTSYLEQDSAAKALEHSIHIERLAAETFRGVRALLGDLQSLHDPDLETALRQLCIEQSTQGCMISLSLSGPADQVREGIPENLLRIAREAILNAKRHGQASTIKVMLSISDEQLRLEIMDNGIGGVLHASEERRHMQKYGLSIMENLALMMDGQLTVGPNSISIGWGIVLLIDSPIRTTEK